MRCELYFAFALSLIEYTTSLMTPPATAESKGDKQINVSCNQLSKTSLVERFFSTIFSEFHNNPPVCICVQMCVNHPTYCYPSGCLNKTEANKNSEASLLLDPISEALKPLLFLSENNNFMEELLDKNKLAPDSAPPPSQPRNILNEFLHPNPFKDRYKMLFKYKRMPKVKVRYNLGEQVKNTKSDSYKENTDISKTRWPLNTINHRYNRRTAQLKDQPTSNSDNFYTLISEKSYTPDSPNKYFKRQLENAINNEKEIKVKENITIIKPKLNNETFSIEQLIDSLIESNYEDSLMNIDKEKPLDTLFIKNPPNDHTMTPTESVIEENYVTEQININTMKININIYDEISETTTTKLTKDEDNTVDNKVENKTELNVETIALLSDKIDEQHNSSLNLIERINRELIIESDLVTENNDMTHSTNTNTPPTTLDKGIVMEIEIAQSAITPELDTSTTKSKQRFRRKLGKSTSSGQVFYNTAKDFIAARVRI